MILRIVTQGLIEVLGDRAAIKRMFRLKTDRVSRHRQQSFEVRRLGGTGVAGSVR